MDSTDPPDIKSRKSQNGLAPRPLRVSHPPRRIDVGERERRKRKHERSGKNGGGAGRGQGRNQDQDQNVNIREEVKTIGMTIEVDIAGAAGVKAETITLCHRSTIL
jgi:hypothetical protein